MNISPYIPNKLTLFESLAFYVACSVCFTLSITNTLVQGETVWLSFELLPRFVCTCEFVCIFEVEEVIFLRLFKCVLTALYS